VKNLVRLLSLTRLMLGVHRALYRRGGDGLGEDAFSVQASRFFFDVVHPMHPMHQDEPAASTGIDNVKIFGLESVLSNGRGDNFFTGIHVAACRKYHLEVDKVVHWPR
jgi:hypothetical protein